MVLVSSGEDLFMSLAGEKGEGWTGESILPLKMMKRDELDTKDLCGILFLENILKLGG